ncbi:DNA polymerase III subunit gamma/tau [Fusibacter bizertensis]|uniref:DNA-directed DNA polymerase n=1 Tax=Fusibacter bizertensis TaxID=1488331 RepID=A0ABT6NFI6_9FIRM|nr:DNA polymerase III subunit gamma/tau [Fusibacter bizertensis]MDH8679193.1 DNA polymerase III subunit gamma/tau [Fusibacter bizertensis]
MSYQALYRQWRPQDFDEIIGQNHITIPLKNQIMSDSYGHAYIFSGTRGTGKTSTAKIFARAVNCLNNTDGNPCNKCSNCLSILEDQFIDVVEMDAASNNSVDDIRELREHIKFAPSKGKYKVYIIDEVHMLSQGAFNALLKTLEEPPEYVLFILATTELHKIPATILSRCQRFDFKRVSYEEILNRLEKICHKLEIEYEIEALKLIIQKSDGAVRDTLSSLDQCLSICEKKLTVADVVEILGVVEKTQILTLVQFLETNQASEVLLTIDNILKQGKDLNQFVSAMIEVYRDILILSMVKENHALLIDASTEYIESLRDISVNLTSKHLSRALDELIELSKALKYAQNKRTLFEATLIRLMYPEIETSIDNLLERIERLEAKLSHGFTPSKVTTQTSQSIQNNINHQSVDQTPSSQTKESSPIESFIEFTESDINLGDIVNQWDNFINTASSEKKGLMPMLRGAFPENFNGSKCTVSVSQENKMFLSILNNTTNVEYLSSVISKLVKKMITLEFEASEVSEDSIDKEERIKNFFKDFNNVLEIK